MTRLEMRTLLRDRTDDDGATQDNTDAFLNSLLNLALLDVQERVLEVDPGAFVSVNTFDLVAAQERYDKPAGFLYEYELAIADTAQGTGWRPLRRASYQSTRRRVSSAVVEYASLGRWFYLSPIPSASVDDALMLTWVYSLSMSADDEVPLLVLPLHEAVVDKAVVKALAGTSETDALERADARAEAVLDRLPRYYRRSRSEAPGIRPEIRNQVRARLPRDVYRS